MLMRVVIVADELTLEKKLSKLLTKSDSVVEVISGQGQFLKKVSRKTCDLIVVSGSLVADDPFKKVSTLRQLSDTPSIVILSEEENEEERAQLIAAGCETVLNPTLSSRKLGDALSAVLDRRRRADHSTLTVRPRLGKPEISDFVASSPAMQKFVRVLPRVARSNSSVLILGETGVGKERLAHVLHAASPRSEGPFIVINCGALPESLLESELFGHEQGAFTGATRSRRGCFELAHQGTIFLDEIGEMPIHLQVKLLRVLENREIWRVGSEKSIPVDVRIMAATNHDLEAEVQARQFRRDLYYRLNVVSLTIPPLRERLEDIPELVDSYINFLGPRIGCEVSGITREALDMFCKYSWPGNVRELINVIERGMLLCENGTITCEDLPETISGKAALHVISALPHEQPPEDNILPKEWLQKPFKKARKDVLERFECSYLTSLLYSTAGRVGRAAKRAGMDPRTLFTKMKQYGLSKEDFRSQVAAKED